MSRRELKSLLENKLQTLSGEHENEFDLNKKPKESAEITPTRRRGRPRNATLSQPNDAINQGNDFNSEEEDDDSTSDEEYKPCKSGKRRVREHESSVDEANPIRRRRGLRKKRKNKKTRRKDRSSQPLEIIRQISVLSSNDKDKAPSLFPHDTKSGKSNEEVKENEALVVDGKKDMPQTKIENRVERLVGYLQDLKRIEQECCLSQWTSKRYQIWSILN